jgi:hypothetical protein
VPDNRADGAQDPTPPLSMPDPPRDTPTPHGKAGKTADHQTADRQTATANMMEGSSRWANTRLDGSPMHTSLNTSRNAGRYLPASVIPACAIGMIQHFWVSEGMIRPIWSGCTMFATNLNYQTKSKVASRGNLPQGSPNIPLNRPVRESSRNRPKISTFSSTVEFR